MTEWRWDGDVILHMSFGCLQTFHKIFRTQVWKKHNSHSGGACSLTRESLEEGTDMGAIVTWWVKLYIWWVSKECVCVISSSLKTDPGILGWARKVDGRSMVRKVGEREMILGTKKRRGYISLYSAYSKNNLRLRCQVEWVWERDWPF